MKCLNRIFVSIMTILVGTLVVQGTTYAQSNSAGNSNSRSTRIVGLWDVDVVVSVCATGDPIATFSAMHKYDLGGTGQVVPSTNPTALSAHMMVWSHVRKNDYLSTFKMYRYDGVGNFVGWTIVRNEVSINKDADEYVGSGVAEFYDANGNFMFSSCPSFVGTRFTVE